MNRLKFLFFLLFAIFVAVKFTNIGRDYVVSLNSHVLESYLNAKQYVSDKIQEHFSQQNTIIRLKKDNAKLEKSALLSIAFAGKLNEILKDNNLSSYNPNVKMIRAISYSDLNNYNRVWLDFKDFNKSKIYGLLYQGNAAGIVVAKDTHPLGLLLADPNSIISVYIGKSKIPGVAEGNKKDILVKYIPIWMNPKVGDIVVTSGLDGIFFQGVRVGKVIEVRTQESSKIAIVQPYLSLRVPTYLHVITKK